MIRVVELFAGIGSQRMALTLAGIPHEVVAICEIDRHALRSYEAIWGDCPNLGDITKVESLPPCDLVTYSFPCQDLSLAGKRKGMAEGSGTRSGLVWEVVRLLEAERERERPEWLLMENVPQVLTAPQWPDLVGRLAAMGYRSKWAKLDSSDFGSAQKRVRAFMVSRLDAEPPDLPRCAPNAPRLCLRDVMEQTRDERFVRRIPLDRVKWREPKEGYRHPQSEGLDCPLMDASDPRLETRRISSERGLCPTLRTGCPQKAVEEEEEERVRPLVGKADNLRMAPKGRKAIGTVRDGEARMVVAPSDSGSSTPTAEDTGESFYSRAMLYAPSSSSPTIRTFHSLKDQVKVVDGIRVIADDTGERFERMGRIYSQDGQMPTLDQLGRRGNQMIKVAAAWDRPGRYRMANDLLSSDGLATTLVNHGGGDREVKVVAEDTSKAYGSSAKVLSSSSSPTLRSQAHGLQNQPKVMDGTQEGDLVVNVLTPLECWRLMGQPYWAYRRASAVCSETQLYNQAGNSIVMEVLEAIFRTMFSDRRVRRQTSLMEFPEAEA